ncbi:hypothetical protein UlMin_003576 [Ulmus minor]
MDEPSSAFEGSAMVDDDYDSDVEVDVVPKFEVKVNYDAKLKELLHRINSAEIKLCSDATKEFIKLLKGDSGGELLRYYVRSSCRCSELLDAWKLRRGKRGISYVFKLVSVILSHPDGLYRPNDKEGIAISSVLDTFSRLIIQEHLQDVYKELNGREVKGQNAALLLMASIVRRGSGLASEVAKNFDFKLKGFSKLAEFKQKANEKRMKRSSRKSFVGFAMSFLEVGKPGLLRWVLQQKEMYSGVLRGLGNDEDETIVYVLSTLKDRILVGESLVSPGLRSVLFGSATLEQLVNVSGKENGVSSAELAYSVLLLVCTNPSNGLMPDFTRRPSPLRGNPRRLLGLMKKLKATEIVYHRDLLLSIVGGRPSFGAAYMEEFPYNLEDFASPTWFATVSLAANLVSAVGNGLNFDCIASQSHGPPSSDRASVQTIMKCLCPRSFSRSVINKGLLHSDFLVKHGTLRLLSEALKLLGSLIGGLSNCQSSYFSDEVVQNWASLKQEVQNEVRTLLPDPQVLLTLLSSLNSQFKSREAGKKRKADSENFPEHGSKNMKKSKKDILNNEDSDIVIAGISFSADPTSCEDDERVVSTPLADEFDLGKDILNVLEEIWGKDICSLPPFAAKDAEIYFQSKLLDALKIYFLIMPTGLEGSFEFFINLLSDPLALHTDLQYSLLSLLIEYVGWSPTGMPFSAPPLMYKHLHIFINLLIFSPISNIRNQAYGLAQAAMLSTGAFDRNCHEIGSWFFFIPGYDKGNASFLVPEVEVVQGFCQVVISFLCDAVSTIGNNLFKYWEIVKRYTCHLESSKDVSLDFSPLVVCLLQKCLRVLDSESGTFTLPEKTTISLYVCDTVKYILQTQVDGRLLSAVIDSILFERLGEHISVINDSGAIFCEWRPLKNLLLFSQSILHQQTCVSSIHTKSLAADSSFEITLSEVERLLRSGNGGEIAGITKGFFSSIVCTTPEEILKNFPLLMTTSRNLLGVPASLMPSIFFLEQTLLTSVSEYWPEIFSSGVEMAVSGVCCKGINDDACGVTDYAPCNGEEKVCNEDFDANEAASAAATFSFFLQKAPFHVLFPSIMSSDGPYSSEPMKIKQLLLAKLSHCKTYSCLVSYLRLLLFWVHQIQSSYRVRPVAKFEELSEICFILVEHLLGQLLGLKTDLDCSRNSRVLPSSQEIQEVAETIFSHPAVVTSLSCPLGCGENLAKPNLVEDMDTLINLSKKSVHKLDHHVLDMLATTSEYLFTLWNDHHFKPEVKTVGGKIAKAFNVLIQRIFKEVKDKFKLCLRTGDLMLLRPFFSLHVLIHFVSPFELLELVRWMFKKVDLDGFAVGKSNPTSALCFAFSIAIGAFKNLSSYLTKPVSKRSKYNLFWQENNDVNIVEEIYIQVTKLALHFETDYVDRCLLEAINASYRQKYMQHHNFDSSSLVLSRVIMTTHVKMLPHCIYKTNKTKAKLLFRLTNMSSLHLSIFGHLFLSIVNKDLLHRGNEVEDSSDLTLSDEDYIILLPAVLSYLNSTFTKFGMQYYKHFGSILLLYSQILLDGFLDWKSFVSNDVFWEDYGNFLPLSTEELLSLVDDSLFRKAIHMLQYHFALGQDSIKMKKRLRLFNSIFPHSAPPEELIDCDVCEMDSYSPSQALNHINRVVAKISLCRMLLFPCVDQFQSLSKEDGILKDNHMRTGSTKEDSSRMHFLNILVGTWQVIVRKFPSVSVSSQESIDVSSLYRYLEVFILRSVIELTNEMQSSLIQLESIPFLEKLMKAALRYRFEDPTTLKMLRDILTVLTEGKFSRDFYLQLLLSHSQFEPTIQSLSNSTNCSNVGAFSRPISGVLRSLVFPTTHENLYGGNNKLETGLYLKQLEIIKLLQILFLSKLRQSSFDFEKDMGIKLRKLHLLLLSSYSAKLSEVDMDIYSLMLAIESIDGMKDENIAGFDYLWGSASSKMEKEQALEHDASNIGNDAEAVKERHKSQFRENLPIDSKLCASTVLYFPYDRIAPHLLLSSNEFQSDSFIHMPLTCSPDAGNVERYDPVFILRFSVHSLSVGYIEPLEFASLGLLAIAFVSMTSPDIGIRKLAYCTLVRFKNALEQCQKRKEVTRIRLLLAYVENGIEEECQRVPSVVAIFAAEASFTLLDPSHDHYATLSKLLTRSPKLNMKSIPLFNELFWSSSINFKSERLWILRLLYAGLNLDDDAQIYIRNSIIETLLSFYVSPLSDNESKDLILQIVKKSIKLHKMARHLVENCGLFSWLSSVLFSSDKRQSSEDNKFFVTQLAAVLEVVNGVISSRNITEWLQKTALEQLMELVSHLYRFLVGGVIFMENSALVNSCLEIMISTLKISQKRKVYQPHFNLSIEGLYQIYKAIYTLDDARTCASAEFGLKAILMSTPPADLFCMSQEKLSSFLQWAISAAVRADTERLLQNKVSQRSLPVISYEKQYEDSLISKLLRWLTASVILGKFATKSNNLDTHIGLNLKDLLEHFETAEKNSQQRVVCEKLLAPTIIYLQHLVGTDYKSLPSVISALSLLLCHDLTHLGSTGHGFQLTLDCLLSKIRCPTEANPSWRWSFYQPWKDLSLELSDSQKMDELHACQTLLSTMSSLLGTNPSEVHRVFADEEGKRNEVFDWEKCMLETDQDNDHEITCSIMK